MNYKGKCMKIFAFPLKNWHDDISDKLGAAEILIFAPTRKEAACRAQAVIARRTRVIRDWETGKKKTIPCGTVSVAKGREIKEDYYINHGSDY